MVHAAVLGLFLVAPAGGPGVEGTYDIGGRFAFKDAVAHRTADWEGRKVVVVLFDRPIDRAALTRSLDVEGVVAAAKEEGSWAQLEFGEDGTWKMAQHQLRYQGGSSSGTKFDGAFAATMKATIEGGRVTGKVRAAFEEGYAVDLTLALPITEPPAGTALPADGGEPGRAVRACAAAFASKALPDVQRLCEARLGEFIASAIAQKESDPWTRSWAGECQVAAVSNLAVQDGVVAGDQARVRASGGWDDDRKCGGDVFLARENGAWRVSASRLVLTMEP